MKFNFTQLYALEMLKGSNVRHLHLEGHYCHKVQEVQHYSLKILTKIRSKELATPSNSIQTEQHQATISIKTGFAYIWPSKSVEESITPQTSSAGI